MYIWIFFGGVPSVCLNRDIYAYSRAAASLEYIHQLPTIHILKSTSEHPREEESVRTFQAAAAAGADGILLFSSRLVLLFIYSEMVFFYFRFP